MKKSPFKFLDSYSKEDRNIFFGRDREIEELHSRVFQSRVLVVYGISGTGKSSLINCGLANKFNDSDWLPVSIRRGSNINQSLVDVLLKNTFEGSASKGIAEAVKLIRSVYLDHFKPVFLIFDQFEEVFIFGTKQERDEFVSTVKRVLDSDLQCRFIFSVREEYLAGFTEFEKIIPDFLENRIRIEKMTRQNATRAIEGPCEVNDISVEPGLPEIILEKLNPDSPDVELTYLQVYLDKLFRIAAKEDKDVKRISCEHADKTGDVKDLLGTFLEEQISQLDDPDTGLVILKSFVSVKGTKHQVTESDVTDYTQTLGRGTSSTMVKDMIQKFIALRILRDKDEHGRYELRHDSLATVIYDKITLVEKELLEIRQFIENSWSNFERRNLYLSAEDLEYIAPYEDKLFLNERLSKLITQSKRIIHQAKRRRQNVMIIVAGTLIAVLSFFSVWAMHERRNALEQQKFAEEQKNAALMAMTIADSARKDAIYSKDLALRNEKIAIDSRAQSELARREAIAQKELALNQKSIADRLSIQSAEQAKIATSEKMRAELERKKAMDAEAEAKRLGMLSTAQNMALTSMSMEKDPLLMGSLAIKAYTYNRENGGQPDDPVIFQALTNAWMVLDSSRHSVFSGSAHEIRGIANNSGLLTADLEGRIRSLDENGNILNESLIQYPSPISFISISPGGRFIATQHDNLDLNFWQYNDGMITLFDKPVRLPGFMRAISFSKDEKQVAYAIDDSTISARKFLNPSDFVTFVTKSVPESITFCNADTICYATSDGSVFLGSISGGIFDKIFSYSEAIPLSLCWNNQARSILSGWSDGRLRILPSTVKSSSPENYAVHDAGIDLIALNNDNSLLSTGSRDRTIRIYFYDEFFRNGNLAGGSVLISDITGRPRSLVFTPDNRMIAGMSDKLIRVWESSPDKLVSGIRNILEKNFSLTESTMP